jgi:hypothetical protein
LAIDKLTLREARTLSERAARGELNYESDIQVLAKVVYCSLVFNECSALIKKFNLNEITRLANNASHAIAKLLNVAGLDRFEPDEARLLLETMKMLDFYSDIDISPKAKAKVGRPPGVCERSILLLASNFECRTGRKATISLDPIGRRYGSAFFSFVESVFAVLAEVPKKAGQIPSTNAALGKQIQRILKQRNLTMDKTGMS